MKEKESMQIEKSTERKKLYEINHPYYCEEAYYKAEKEGGWGAPITYDSIEEYINEWDHEDTDQDMNFIFRWDWYLVKSDKDIAESTVKVFYMMQRKGCKKVITIEGANVNEEPLLYEHLKKSWAHMKKTWEGVSDD